MVQCLGSQFGPNRPMISWSSCPSIWIPTPGKTFQSHATLHGSENILAYGEKILKFGCLRFSFEQYCNFTSQKLSSKKIMVFRPGRNFHCLRFSYKYCTKGSDDICTPDVFCNRRIRRSRHWRCRLRSSQLTFPQERIRCEAIERSVSVGQIWWTNRTILIPFSPRGSERCRGLWRPKM